MELDELDMAVGGFFRRSFHQDDEPEDEDDEREGSEDGDEVLELELGALDEVELDAESADELPCDTELREDSQLDEESALDEDDTSLEEEASSLEEEEDDDDRSASGGGARRWEGFLRRRFLLRGRARGAASGKKNAGDDVAGLADLVIAQHADGAVLPLQLPPASGAL